MDNKQRIHIINGNTQIMHPSYNIGDGYPICGVIMWNVMKNTVKYFNLRLEFVIQSDIYQHRFEMTTEKAQNYNELFKIILAGDANVGKTNLVHRFVKPNHESKNITPTIGVEFGTTLVRINENRVIKAQIWDTAGQEQYRAITTAHYRKALGALVVYDITKQQTFTHVRRWIQSIREQADPNVVVTLIGNKTDLEFSDRQVNSNEARKYAKNQGLLFFQTSAKQNRNVEEAFRKTIEEIDKRVKERQQAREDGNTSQFLSGNKRVNQKCEC